VEAAETLPDVTAVLSRIPLPSSHHHVVVDVICCQGQTWVKVIARNSKALTIDLNGKLLLMLRTLGDTSCLGLFLQVSGHNAIVKALKQCIVCCLSESMEEVCGQCWRYTRSAGRA